MSENAALDIVRQCKCENAQLGVVLALIERPAIVSQVVAQLDSLGPLGAEVYARYNEAKALLNRFVEA